MTAGESTCREGGVIIMVAACEDGHGGEFFRKTIAEGGTPAQILDQIQSTPPEHTLPDQWESQILARILNKHHVVLVTRAEAALVRSMQMHPASDIPQALAIAQGLLGREGSITVIPEGISTIVG